ncbi:hypothetical protein MACK_004158 (apicoplast) [Theileria orientalis]|uniref:Uncharacterized protein n=1 Tax=Theileria orientalis TaxID=68886 RepID=A0A976SI38_THEOR|nr:hypothetical protein MACK_004158 [Theileria orientalis]
MTNNNYKKKNNKKPVYFMYFNTIGIYKYKSKLILNLCNININKKHSNLNKMNYECMNTVNKHSTFNINLLKTNSIKLNYKRLHIIKKNENKNINKKNM